MKKTQLKNFELIANKQLENIYGGFAWIPIVQWAIFGFLSWKVLISDKGNAKFDGVGSINFENNRDHKNSHQTRIIYYPF